MKPYIHASNLKATIDGIEYHWDGGFGSVLKSYEKGIKLGELRAIGRIIFRAYHINHRMWGKNEVHWTTVEDVDADWIQKQSFLLLNGYTT